ncbi:MAG: DUF2279 domain-containing protein [Polaribacter sp.]|nr:DUF2279 domain-containing protein [Polaribacter sp.]
MFKKNIYLLLLSLSISTVAQTSFYKKADTLNTKRRNAIAISATTMTAGALIALNQLWYKEYPRSNFHLKNDNKDWKQMDKTGHFMTSYYLGKLGMEVLDWAGVSEKHQIIYGATYGFSFLTAVEILDGYSDEWGASPGDIVANAAGTGLLIGQELLWNEQRITVKYSFHPTEIAKQRPNTLGKNYLQQTLKDYNGQTYWLSANIWSFNKESSFPKWINIALGYGADQMLYGNSNTGNAMLENPYRQFYLSLDLDLTKIETNSEFLKTIFSVINFIKIPAPALEISSKGGLSFHYLYF